MKQIIAETKKWLVVQINSDLWIDAESDFSNWGDDDQVPSKVLTTSLVDDAWIAEPEDDEERKFAYELAKQYGGKVVTLIKKETWSVDS